MQWITLLAGLGIGGFLGNLITTLFNNRNLKKERLYRFLKDDFENAKKDAKEILRLIFRQKFMVMEMRNELQLKKINIKKWLNEKNNADLKVLSERTFYTVDLLFPSLERQLKVYENTRVSFVNCYFEITRKGQIEEKDCKIIHEKTKEYDKRLKALRESLQKELRKKENRIKSI